MRGAWRPQIKKQNGDPPAVVRRPVKWATWAEFGDGEQQQWRVTGDHGTLDLASSK
ncbi:unnamed protein product, partial [Staurois parvus]